MKNKTLSWQLLCSSDSIIVKCAMKSSDWCKILVLITSLCQVTPCTSCGDNPFGRYETVIKKIHEKFPGRDIATLLTLAIDTNPTVFKPLLADWKRYTNCIGLVDTGYFKRSAQYVEYKRDNPGKYSGQDEKSERWMNGPKSRRLRFKVDDQVVKLLQLLMTELNES
ncbi:hypothetical protein Btru_019346 [Bulinus truncatus]|nr:hypothetical protein Btru_019346 [Bulinus truncatus]